MMISMGLVVVIAIVCPSIIDAYHLNQFDRHRAGFISTAPRTSSIPPSSTGKRISQHSFMISPLSTRQMLPVKPFTSRCFVSTRLDASVSPTDDETKSTNTKKSKSSKLTPKEATTSTSDELDQDDDYFDQLFDTLASQSTADGTSSSKKEETLVDFIEQSVGIQKKKRGRSKHEDSKDRNEKDSFSVEGKDRSLRFEGEMEPSPETTADKSTTKKPIPLKTAITPTVSIPAAIMEEQPPPSVNEKKGFPYNVVCTHITADFDTLASAIGLAKLWSMGIYDDEHSQHDGDEKDSVVNGPLPTYVVLPRGAHPDVQRFLSLHKHLFPIRGLKSLPGFSDADLKKSNNNNYDDEAPNEGLQRVGLVDAQRRDRLGPADILLPKAKRGCTIVDHHVDAESDIPEANNYIVENVGSVSTMIAERLRNRGVELTEAEATILALGIHSDTGSLVYDSTTPKDASMLGWAMEMGASQPAIAEHAKPTLSDEQQGVLTQALINVNTTRVHGVTISTVLLSADGFISGLAAVTKDALDLSSSDVFLLAVCYEATRGAKGGGSGGAGGGGNVKGKGNNKKNEGETSLSKEATARLQKAKRSTVKALAIPDTETLEKKNPQLLSHMINSDSWKGGEAAFQRQRLAATFALHDTDQSGFLERKEIAQALRASGFLMSQDNFQAMIDSIDTNGDGR
eukprot:g3574.t1 g3574   contig12:2350866-2353254(+)